MEPEQLRAAIVSAQAGKAAGFEALLDAYGQRLFGYFLRATGHHHDAEDLLSDLSLRLVKQLSRYDDRGRFEPWLFRIAANMVRDRIRRRKVRPAGLSLSLEGTDGGTMADRLPGRHEPVDAKLLAGEASLAMRAALDNLEFTTREMILLRYFGQMSFKELADTFDCPLGTVLARVHRGLAALRDTMADRET